MEPDHSGKEQTSPRGNDWEVVQLTASAYAAAPAPRRPEPSEEAEAKKYSTKGDDSAAALLMSGHFSVSQTEVESLLIGADSKEPHKELCSQDAVSNEGDEQKYQETCKHKLEGDLPSIPSSLDKGKNVTLGDMEFDDGKALQGMSLVGEESVGFSSPIYSSIEAEQDLGRSAMESRNEKNTQESTLHIVNPKTGSSNVVSSGEQNKPDGSGPRDAWWKKQLLSLYKNAKESNNFWPIIAAAAAAAALVGLAYFGHRWHKGKLQLQLGKQPPSSNKEKMNDTVGPLNRIKDILVAGNHPSPGIHGHARASGM
ncbi:ATG8-interacting protein 1-like [Panicum virgatum]|uniref:ATG8-interacting protein 1 n=1 Tax=Panicum virgatum TaxID=38727 RepID=A0A8T0WZX7_PANVG|nr:ATG8-interacting protein 1-like [Panicum virgatum]XP_039791986.1 ATG8-interacting protein 1-like [Panicum virgatum]KAG2655061.1 hypothetical protein PVAP13_1NG553100 [Panicum virgatum]KAG2655063.1 hypothetical protein PVAP13_1NG553100 [Panicum virgatum]KAG2655064.1 hypothetical protein PVAP13_1NG553100 [Panicum virgatum]